LVDTVRRCLLASGEVIYRKQSLKAAAAQFDLDEATVARWVAAQRDAAVKQPSHPLHPWTVLAALQGQLSPRDFLRQRERLEAGAKQAADADEKSPRLADFRTFDEGWFVTGEAFGQSPTRAAQWDSRTRGVRIAVPGIADSGLLSSRLEGVLRSPTFTITHKNIYYRIAGQNAQIRLIVDGYFMDVFNGLLFRGLSFDVNTDGQFLWHKQSDDLSKYIGHRAHIEIIDHGDGFVAIDEIRFSDGGPPPAEANPLARQVFSDPNVTSLDDLAAAYGRLWTESLDRWHRDEIDADTAKLMNWALEHELFELNQFQPGRLGSQLAGIAEQLDAISKTLPAPVHVLAIADGTGQNDHVHIRGNYRTLGEEVPRRLLEALGGSNQAEFHQGSGRLAIARQIADPANPLTARVMVNRLWQHLFGRGIVASVDNFGVLGDAPTHPELLDYLAQQFVTEGWSIKRLIRSLVLSNTYQMSSAPDGQGDQLDPQNLLLHRMRIRRLEGEVIRDAMLAISGRLDPALFGDSVPVHLTPFMEGRGRPGASGPLDGAGRRSIYIKVRRNFLPPMMLAFDTPLPFSAVGRRNESNVPAQALIMMNDPLVIGQARVWAQRLLHSSTSTEQRIHDMYTTAVARPPTPDESAAAVAFLDQQGEALGLSAETARQDSRVWADLCHVLMNVKEFIFIN
jgi:hypothetical protein